MSKRTDLAWREWGFHRYSPRGWWQVYTPAGSFGIDRHRSVTEQGLTRGRRQEWDLRIPLFGKWQIHLSTAGKSYHEREQTYQERILQARHDFVDIMHGLWS